MISNPTMLLSASLTLSLPPRTGSISALAWSENNEHLAAVSSSGVLVVWKTSNGACLLHQRVTRASLRAVAWTQQGQSLLLGSAQGTLLTFNRTLSVFHLATRTLLRSSTFSEPVNQISWSPNALDTRFFVRTGCTLRIFTQGKPEARVLHYSTPLADACWAPDGQAIALVCTNGLVEVWDARTQRMTWRQEQFHARASRLTWDATGHRLAIGTQAGTIQIQDMRTRHCSAAVSLSRFPIQALGWGERYLVAGSAYDVAFWHEAEEQPQCQTMETTPTFTFDNQGAILATALSGQIALATLS